MFSLASFAREGEVVISYKTSQGFMQKKHTITLDEKVYEGLHAVAGRRRISRFIEDLVRPKVSKRHLETTYKEMAEEERREAEALAWSEATVRDVSDEMR